MAKKLYRSETDKMIAGVCGGLGEYFNIDSTLIRIAFVLILLSGSGLLLYIILWIVIPTRSQSNVNDSSSSREPKQGVFYATRTDTKKK